MMLEIPLHYRPLIDYVVTLTSPGDQVYWDYDSLEESNRFAVDEMLKLSKVAIERVKRDYSIEANIYVAAVASMDFQAMAMQLSETEYCVLIWNGALIRASFAPGHLVNTQVFKERFGTDFMASEFPSDLPPARTFVEEMALTVAPNSASEYNGQVAYVLTICIMEWLILHELGHIVNGHFAFGKIASGIKYILERDWNPSDENMVTEQTLEFDADAFASMQLMNFLSVHCKGFIDIMVERGKFGNLSIPALAMITVDIAAKFLEYEVDGIEDLFKYDHPLGEMRAHMNQGTIIQVLMNGGRDVTELGSLLLSVGLTTDKALHEITGKKPTARTLEVFQASDGYLDKIARRWSTIRPKLEPHALGTGKLAPAEFPPENDQ